LGLNVLELTGDVTPDAGALRRADIIITTPEKWDGVTRQWRNRDYVKAVRRAWENDGQGGKTTGRAGERRRGQENEREGGS
jgi:hypothetical protein